MAPSSGAPKPRAQDPSGRLLFLGLDAIKPVLHRDMTPPAKRDATLMVPVLALNFAGRLLLHERTGDLPRPPKREHLQAAGVADRWRLSPIRIDTCWTALSPGSGWLGTGPADADARGEHSRSGRPLQTCRVLVVDDDETILAAVSGILAQEGFQVDTATNGSEALDAVERTRPNVVLLDMRMPVVDGWAFARIVREREIDLRIVAMTAAQDARRWATEIGADAYLAKPFDLDDLIAIIERCCAE